MKKIIIAVIVAVLLISVAVFSYKKLNKDDINSQQENFSGNACLVPNDNSVDGNDKNGSNKKDPF